jgi:hypothetical protein
MPLSFLLENTNRNTPIILTVSSVAGNANQTPVMPPIDESRKAIGMMIKNPRKKEIICAGRGCSVEVKKIEIIILNPVNRQAVK